MNWVFVKIKDGNFLSPPQPAPPPPPNLETDGFSLTNKVSPTILLIIIILAIIFFVSGLLHLLVRFLLRLPNSDPDDFDDATVLQGQLQQLFHLHDAGVDQSFIDILPVFNYKSIIGVKNPFDCAVCLCEFEGEDKLRLLPKCSHAFHMECIDTWLLSHSTCPLCRACLLSDFSSNNNCSPIVLLLESGSESSREIVSDREGILGTTANSVVRANSHLGVHCHEEFGSSRVEISQKSCEIQVKEDANQEKKTGAEEKVVTVKLGKFKNVDGGSGGECSGNSNVDGRRCFSMGSFEYVMDENTSLQVPLRTPMKKQPIKKPSLPLIPGHKPAMSECGCDSRRDFNGFEAFKSSVDIHGGTSTSISNSNGDNGIGRSNRESFSVSKIWLRGKKEKPNSTAGESSRRAFSFRFPVHRNVVAADEMKPKNEGNGGRRSISEINIGKWDTRGSELGCDEENQSCNSLDSQANPPSFSRRTILWLMGRQNKVVHSTFPTNI